MSDTTKEHVPTIVYVEDNAGDALLVEEALREQGHVAELVIIDNGENALRYFTVKATARDLPPPHCILLDSYLPVVAGVELLRFLCCSPIYDNTPVYLFSNAEESEFLRGQSLVPKENIVIKSQDWNGMLDLADRLMQSAAAKLIDSPACGPKHKGAR